MYYLTTYWFSVQNSDSYLLRKKYWTLKHFVPLWRNYHSTNITHMNFIHVIPIQSQQSLYVAFLHVTAAHTHTHTCTSPSIRALYKTCAAFCNMSYDTALPNAGHTFALLSVTTWALLLSPDATGNTHNHTASVRFTDALHMETDYYHKPYSHYMTSEIGNYIVKAMKKKSCCEDPNRGR